MLQFSTISPTLITTLRYYHHSCHHAPPQSPLTITTTNHSNLHHFSELEFVCIALATWHIPLENVIKDTSSSSSYVGSTLSYSSYGGGGSGDHRRRDLLAGSSYSSSYGGGNDDVVVLTPVDQLRGNVDGCAFGFSVFLGLNCLIYVGRWVEVSTDP
jgi:hypothetical protein